MSITGGQDIVELLSETNRRWAGRAAAELNLLAALGSALVCARSLPDAAAAYGDLMTERMNMIAEDGRRVVEDSERFAQAAARMMTGNRGAM